MVIKKPNKTKTIPLKYNKNTDIIPTVNENQSTGGLLSITTPTSPQTGSPTTADSGLVSPKVTKTGTKTARQKANVTSKNPKPQIRTQIRNRVTIPSNPVKVNELRISQKRMLAHSFLRTLQKYELVLDKVLKFIVNRNDIQNPSKQNLNYGIEVNSNTDSAIMKIVFHSDKTDSSFFSELKKNIKDIEVTPFNSTQPNEIGFYIKTVAPTTTNKKK